LEVQYEDQDGTTTNDTIKIVTTSEEIIVGTQVMDFVSRNSELVSLQTEVEGICDETTGEALGDLEDFFDEIAGYENDFNVGGAYLIFWMP
ncbi:MAG: hypothetical protein HOJ35_10665, partial [Bdellovibrionales bacterium]|nr:hypothetical protein [Bdellovibrionales bacterium]